MNELTVERCAEFISSAGNIVILTGAGISTAAGIPDFRGPDGLYVTRKYDPDTIFNIEYFMNNPRPFFEFSRDFFEVINDIRPTFTHYLLAGLEKRGKVTSIVTQNIDPLHSRAGSEKLIEVHGSYNQSFCLSCRKRFALEDFLERLFSDDIPVCDCGKVIKPDVVFFGEAVKGMDQAQADVSDADLLIVLGSSLTVYPAAFLPQYANCTTLVVNKGRVGLDPSFDRWFAEADLDGFFRGVSEVLGFNQDLANQ